MMTTKLKCAVIALVMLTAACSNQKRVATTLNDPQQREAVLDSIAGDTALLQKVNEKAKAKGTMNGMNGMNDMPGMNMDSDSTMMGMMSNPAMMGKMMDMMMAQCEKDTAMCRSMCTKMMDNPKMMKMMRDMMKNRRMDTTKGKMNKDNQ